MVRIKKNEYDVIRKERYFRKIYDGEQKRISVKASGIARGPYHIELTVDSPYNRKTHMLKFYGNGYFKICHPKNENFSESGRCVSSIMERITETHEKVSMDSLLSLLGIYYHNVIHWMPFAYVNNSLFMGQVNCILRHNNMNSIPHGNLDTYAMLTSTHNFIGIFKKHIQHHQH
jgi:hypothetical protein